MAHLVPALDESKLRIQKGVVKNEYRQNYSNRPYGMVWPILAEALYPPQHPYSWLTIGVMEDLDSASLEDVSAFFQRYYVPANASLAMVGDIDLDRSRSLVERYFGAIDGGTKALQPWVASPAIAASRDIVLQDRVELDRYYAVWHSVPHFHDGDAPLSLLADILARGQGKPALPEARDRPAARSGCDSLPVRTRACRHVWHLGDAASVPFHRRAPRLPRDRDRPDRGGGCDRARARAGRDHEDGELPLRPRAHRRVRRSRRSAQCLSRFPGRPVADHDRSEAVPGGHCGCRPRRGGRLSGRKAEGDAVRAGPQARGQSPLLWTGRLRPRAIHRPSIALPLRRSSN